MTKHMRSLLAFDYQNVKGSRLLRHALEHREGQRGFVGYDFNPDASSSIQYDIEDSTLTLFTDGIVVPKGADSVGVTIVSLAFDFETGAALLRESDKHFFKVNSVEKVLRFEVDELEDRIGVLFTILVVDFYQNNDGGFVPMDVDVDKTVLVVDVG